MTRLALSVIAIAFAGCAEPGAPANAQLGIVHYDVTSTDTAVHLGGVDAQGAQIARLDLRTGPVTLDDGRSGDGRELLLWLRGRQGNHASIGLDTLRLPIPNDDEFAALLADPFVAARLASWNVAVVAHEVTPPPAGETGYQSCIIDYPAPCQQFGVIDCCQNYDFHPMQSLCCNPSGAYPHGAYGDRICGYPPNDWTDCGQAGPQGCATCWQLDWYGPAGSCRAAESYGSCYYYEAGGYGGGGGGCTESGGGCGYEEYTADASCCSGYCQYGACQ